MKYIVVTGGVISGIGKGIVTSSVGALLKACNIEVTAIKIDPYINIDAGTFSPYEHGETFVLDDGCEVDLDLGNYERFLDTNLHGDNNITTGKIYRQVIDKERRGDYLGKTVQMVPHITDAIQEWIEKTAKIEKHGKQPDVCLIELGGTIGDIEGRPFIEALFQLRCRVKRENFCTFHVSMVPCIGHPPEPKSKPTQHSVIELKSLKLDPDVLVCRSEIPLQDHPIRDKLSSYCGVDLDSIFSLHNLKTIYRAPVELEEQGMLKTLAKYLNLHNICPCDRLARWRQVSEIAVHASEQIIIALVGKYTALRDCYTSVTKALEHACYDIGAKPIIKYIDSSLLEECNAEAWQDLKTAHCLIVPGGFGIRGVEGKIAAIQWARENKLPFLGVCLGFQLAVVEYARNVLGIKTAHSGEFKSELKELKRDFEPLVIKMLEYQDKEKKMGGTMRLGLRKTIFHHENSILRRQYGNVDAIEERHRHRYEINGDHIPALEKAGLMFVGKSEDQTRMEILELDQTIHPYFVGVQYHPEYLSRLLKPSPPYKGLVDAARVLAFINETE